MKNPNAFQGTKRKNNYFEGWYLKHQKGDQMFSVIPAYHIDREGNAFSSLQVITKAQSWYEMNLSVCKNGAVLLGNDNMIHLCAYLLFIWVSLTLIYAIAIFFQNICKRPWIAGAIGIGAMLFPNFIISRYNISWLVDGCIF